MNYQDKKLGLVKAQKAVHTWIYVLFLFHTILGPWLMYVFCEAREEGGAGVRGGQRGIGVGQES